MQKRSLFLIILFTVVALMGLITIQIVWIKYDIQARNSNFDKSMNEAVSNAIYKLDKIEFAKEIDNELSILQDQFQLKELFDSIASSIEKPGTNSLYDSILSLTQKEQYLIMQQIFQRTFMIRDVVREVFNSRKLNSMAENIDVALLDSLLHRELALKGVFAGYEFGIYNPQKKQLIIERTGRFSQELLDQGARFNIFPQHILNQSDQLIIYFPQKNNYLIKQLWKLLLSSFIFISVLGFLFWYTINTIIHQKKLSDLKTDFINNMTHEFKTPVSTISLACQALKDPDMQNSPDAVKTYIQMISEENSRLGNMAEKILQAAKTDMSHFNFKIETLNIHHLIESVLEKTRLKIDENHGSIQMKLGASEALLQGDRIHLTNVIFNLLDNAIKYSIEKPEIKVETKNHNNGVTVSVIDRGIGISKSEQKKVFDKLYRVPTGDVHDVKGFGLGLSYVKAVVENLGGEVKLQSEPGNGTIVSFWLPHDLVK